MNHAAIALPAHWIMPNPLLSLTLTGVLHGPGRKERLDRVLAPYKYRQPRRFERAFYLTDDGVLERVQTNEQSLGWPTARFELTFDAPAATP